jgi:putative addiction module component (TIGR02574 family)
LTATQPAIGRELVERLVTSQSLEQVNRYSVILKITPDLPQKSPRSFWACQRQGTTLFLIERPFAVSRCFDRMPAMQSELTEQAKKLSIPDRILLVEEIWDTIAEENQAFELTDAQKQELDRRLESVRTNPGQGRTWEEIKAEFMKSR